MHLQTFEILIKNSLNEKIKSFNVSKKFSQKLPGGVPFLDMNNS